MTVETNSSSYSVINENTGEIVAADVASYQTKKQHTFLRSRKHTQELGSKRFIKCYNDSMKEISEMLNLTQAGALMRLLSYLKLSGKGKLTSEGKPLKQADMQQAFNKGRNAVTKIVKALEAVDVLKVEGKGRGKKFYINEAFHHMGSGGRKSLFTRLYLTKARKLLERLTLEEAGLVYKLMPYVNYRSLLLCDKPDEENAAALNVTQLAEAINYDRSELTKKLKSLRRKGAIMMTDVYGVQGYAIHPDMINRGSIEDETKKILRNQFNSMKRSLTKECKIKGEG